MYYRFVCISKYGKCSMIFSTSISFQVDDIISFKLMNFVNLE